MDQNILSVVNHMTSSHQGHGTCLEGPRFSSMIPHKSPGCQLPNEKSPSNRKEIVSGIIEILHPVPVHIGLGRISTGREGAAPQHKLVTLGKVLEKGRVSCPSPSCGVRRRIYTHRRIGESSNEWLSRCILYFVSLVGAAGISPRPAALGDFSVFSNHKMKLLDITPCFPVNGVAIAAGYCKLDEQRIIQY